MSVQLDESETSIGLESRLDDEAKVLEQWNNIIWSRVRSQVANIDGRLPARGLRQDDLVASNAMRRELVVSVRSSRGQSHGLHGLLLRHGRLTLLVRPVAPDCSRSKPLSVHGAQSFLGLGSISEGDKSVTSRSASLHIPHNTSFRNGSKGGEGLEENLVIDLVGQVTDKDVKVVRCVLLGCSVRQIGPVHPDFLFDY